MSDNLRVPRELRHLARQARAAGWTISARGSGHLRWLSPSGTIVTSSCSPGTRHEPKLIRARLRRAGLPCP